MKKLIILLSLFSFCSAQAQKVHLKSGEFEIQNNLETIQDFYWTDYQFENKTYVLIQFNQSTSQSTRAEISQQTGIQFFDYIPRWAFVASIPSNLNPSILQGMNVKGIIPYESKFKLAQNLVDRPLPYWVDLPDGRIQIEATIQNDVEKAAFGLEMISMNIEIAEWENDERAVLYINESQINELSKKAFIKHMQPISAPGELENLESRASHRTNTLSQDYASGRHYDGTGVAVSMGDDGRVDWHIDFKGRLSNFTNDPTGTHGDHVLGTVGSAGNFDPTVRGNGPGADLVVYGGYGNLNNAANDYNNYGVRITTNSLGQGCNGGYNNDARDQDQLILSRESLISVHSAGNSGTSSCGGVNGFKNITGGYKQGKNGFATGNLVKNDVIANSSSRGPAEDGRIKPDVCAVGTSVTSTQPNNGFATYTGTSMAAPGLAGTLASLWHAYKELNSGNDPNSALMKGIVLTTANDLGNPGPDFKYGWGRLNALRAVEVLENNQYLNDTIANNALNLHTINVPAGVAEVKFMVYWHDPAGAANAAIPLVNDLNLVVTDPAFVTHNPWVLDYTPNLASLNANAVNGNDSVNNMEQVSILNPVSGNHTIRIQGVDVPSGPQSYYLVYDFIMDDVRMTYPTGGEHFEKGYTERLRWEANDNGQTFLLEYSDDAGSSWNQIANNIPSDDTWVDWTPPNSLETGQMMMRITRGTQSDVTDTLFTVYEAPLNVEVDTACNSIFHVSWDPVPNADRYTVYQLGAKYMDSVASSTTTGAYLTTGVNLVDTFYFAVRAHMDGNGASSRRSLAYEKLPGSYGCGEDLENVETIMPFSTAYDCAPLNNIQVQVKFKNISPGGLAINSAQMSFTVNGGAPITETWNGTLSVGDSLIYTFLTPASLPGAGNYIIETEVNSPLDGNAANNLSTTQVTINPVTIMPAPLVQDFEGATYPPNGWEVIDADNSVKWQKTFAQSGAVFGNTHAAYMDFYNYPNSGAVDILQSPVVNLQGVSNDSVILSFDVAYVQQGISNDALEVLISNDCGVSFVTPYLKAGASLASGLSSSTIFSPVVVNEWRGERIDLSAYKGQQVLVQFMATNRNGNNLYLDNINITLSDAWPLGLTDAEKNSVVVYPNPSDGNYIIKILSDKQKNILYKVKSVTGQVVKQNQFKVSSGVVQNALDISELSSGMYILEMFDGEAVNTIKLMKN